MSIVDSTAAFVQHCDSVDPSGTLKGLLTGQNINTYSKLAFAIGTPQKPPTEDEFSTFCTNLNRGVNLSISELSAVKRVHFEAVTIVVANLKSRVSADAGLEGVRKIPNAEKQARLISQQKRLTGIVIAGELQPSHALIDLANSMCDSNNVIWISPSKCSKREAEIAAGTKDKSSLVSIEQQTLKVSPAEPEVKTNTSSELLWQWAMMRRGIALDQCGLIEWGTHQLWIQQLLSLLAKDAPAGYAKITVEQLVRADKELFNLMAQDLQMKDVRLTDTPAPMNALMQALRTDPRITMYLLPLAKGVVRTVGADEDKDQGASKNKQPPKDPKPKKRQTPTKRARNLCPQELQGYKLKDSDGQPICWHYNMAAGWSEQVSNHRCRKGMHKCIKCHRVGHSLTSCRAASA